ncbi:MAG: ACT domain-containing protein, partial [Oxalobacteraceae bacterium]
MLAGMTPVLRDGSFIFCITNDPTLAEQARTVALSWFREDEGTAMILDLPVAALLGFDVGLPMRRIVLEVYSALDGVGLTAAVANALAGANISCNVVSAYHHDNVFVPAAIFQIANGNNFGGWAMLIFGFVVIINID